jgi:hypothetical protein
METIQALPAIVLFVIICFLCISAIAWIFVPFAIFRIRKEAIWQSRLLESRIKKLNQKSA